MSRTAPAGLGIAGVNTLRLHAATLGIAGNWGTTLRARSPFKSSRRLGDRAAAACWARACYFLDFTYITCPDRATRALRYRSGFARMCAPETRTLPVYLDSGAFRQAVGTAPSWNSYTRYCEALDLVRPDGAMARDVLDDQVASREGYDRLCSDGYRDVVSPVWQARPAWQQGQDAAANGQFAARDPTLRVYVDRAPMVANRRACAGSLSTQRCDTCTWPNWRGPSRTRDSGHSAS